MSVLLVVSGAFCCYWAAHAICSAQCTPSVLLIVSSASHSQCACSISCLDCNKDPQVHHFSNQQSSITHYQMPYIRCRSVTWTVTYATTGSVIVWVLLALLLFAWVRCGSGTCMRPCVKDNQESEQSTQEADRRRSPEFQATSACPAQQCSEAHDYSK